MDRGLSWTPRSRIPFSSIETATKYISFDQWMKAFTPHGNVVFDDVTRYQDVRNVRST